MLQPTDNSTPQQDREANYFAMCLLMPTDLVFKELEKLPKTLGFEETIERMAAMFKVSVPMMTLRLSQLDFIR